MKQKRKKKKNIPKTAHKMVIDNQEWFYIQTIDGLIVFDPDRNHYKINYGASDRRSWSGFLPGDIRLIIEEEILNNGKPVVAIRPDNTVELGKLYVPRENEEQPNEGFIIHSSAQGHFIKRKYWHEHLEAGLPVIPVQHWVADKQYHYKLIVGEKIGTIYFRYPRTWGGYFKRLWLPNEQN